MATRDAVSAEGNSSASTTLTITFTGSQPIAGDKVAVAFWSYQNSTSSITVSSVKDNATVQNTYTVGRSQGATEGTDFESVWIYWLDLPSNATWSGNYTITVTFAASQSSSDGGAIAYGGLSSGAPAATNQNSGTGTAVTSGAVNPGAGTATYVAGFTDASSGNPATITWSSPFSGQISQNSGVAHQVGSVGDDLNDSGSQNASITIDNVNWQAVVAAWLNAATGVPQITYGYGPN